MSTSTAETKTPAASVDASSSKNTMSNNPLLVASYAAIVGVWGVSQVVYIPYVVHLLVLVTAILYCACHASLVLREEPPEGSEHGSEKETLKAEDAYQFPLVGSVSLFSLYLAFKFLDADLVNLLIGVYFAVVGCLAMTMTLSPLVSKLLPASWSRSWSWSKQIHHSLPEWLAGPSPWKLSIEFSGAELLTLLGSAAVCFFYFQTKPWYLNNVLGISFCLQGIERFSLGTYKIGAILLIGLFFYDIFWVFGTDVMVTVAKKLDGPIKLLFPRGSLEVKEETGNPELSLLGLGDIVIPGFFLALLLRFDAHKAQLPTSSTDIYASFPKPYFVSALIAYILGLGTTLFVMLQFNAAQPALLYLVPACLGSSFVCALARGEVKELLDYSEEEEVEEAGESGDDAKDVQAKKTD